MTGAARAVGVWWRRVRGDDPAASAAVGRAAQLIVQGYAVTLVGLAVGVCSARSLALEERGTLALLLLAGQLFSRFGSLGFEQLVQKHGFEHFPLLTHYRALLVGCVLLAPAIWGFIAFCQLPPLYFPATLVAAVIVGVLKVNTAFLIHRQRLADLFVVNLFQALVQLALFLAVAFTHRYPAFYGAWGLAVSLSCAVSLARIRPLLGPAPAGSPGVLAVWRASRAYTTVALPETVLAFCLELPLIRVLLGGASAGLYAISNTFTNIYFQVFSALSAILIGRPLHRRRPLYLGLAVLGALMVLLCRPVIVLLFGEPYAAASRYVEWMLPATFFLGVARIEQVTAGRPVAFAVQTAVVGGFCALLVSALLLPSGEFVVPYIALCYTLCALAILASTRWGGARARPARTAEEGS